MALILLMAFVAPLHAQTTLKAIPITSANQLVDGGTYLVSAFSSKKKEYYCDFHIQRIKETEDFYWLKKISVFNQPEQAATESDLLVMQYSGGRWFLYSPQANGYIGPDVESIQQRALVSPSQTDDNAGRNHEPVYFFHRYSPLFCKNFLVRYFNFRITREKKIVRSFTKFLSLFL